MRLPRRLGAWTTASLLLALFASCASSEDAASECKANRDCPSGSECVRQSCHPKVTEGGSAGDRGDTGGEGAAGGQAGSAGGAGAPDASADASVDAAPTADAPPEAPVARFPWNGYFTGSARAPTASLAVAPRRPTFRWTASAGATRYELELDSACDVSGFETCAFASAMQESTTETFLTVAELAVEVSSAPMGQRYFWRVRACNDVGCSEYTPVRYVDVGRMPNDFNGDGYADLVVAAPLQDNPEPNEGEIYVYYGSGGGLVTTPSLTIESQLDEASAAFGGGVAAAGDVNADGFSDLVVGAYSADGDQGRVFVFLGGSAGLSTSSSMSFTAPSPEVGARFGWAIDRAGDVDGDGFGDVIVGEYFRDGGAVDEGRAYLYSGGSAGLAAMPSVTIDSPTQQGSASFGVAVSSAGDVNGDGFADVLVGAHTHDAGTADQGSAFVFLGAAGGLDLVPHRRLDNPENEPGGLFGFDVAGGGDLDGDGFADLVVAGSKQDGSAVDSGKLWVYRGSPGGVPVSFSTSIANPGAVVGGRFGRALSARGDVNADGFSDLVVGADQQTGGGQGKVFVFFGSASGPAQAPDLTIDNPNPVDTAAQFGSDVEVADTRGDGEDDVLAGAERASVAIGDEGRAFVFEASGGQVSTTASVTLNNPMSQSGRFGRRVTGR